MKANTITCLFLITLTVCSCAGNEKSTPAEKNSRLKKAGWLLGSWENNSEQGRMAETWVKDGTDAFTAETYFIIGTDTVFREHSELKETGKNLECTITIPNENKGKPITFKLTKQDDHSLRFENPAHDFPQVISYSHKGDSVIAEISGMQEGKFAKERFAMVRVRN